jgi:hypothetical protein
LGFACINLRNTIHNLSAPPNLPVTILEPTIKNGYFHGILFDIYDFDIEYYDYYNSAFITAANDYFWHLQEKYPYKVFYILAPVTFKW